MFLKIAQKGSHSRTVCYLKLLLMVAFCLTQGIQTCTATSQDERKNLLDDSTVTTSYSSPLNKSGGDTVIDFSTTTTTQTIMIPTIDPTLLTPQNVTEGANAWVDIVKFLKLFHLVDEYNKMLAHHGNDFEKRYEENKKEMGGGFENFKREKVENAWNSKQVLQLFLGGLKTQVLNLQPLVSELHQAAQSQQKIITDQKQQILQLQQDKESLNIKFQTLQSGQSGDNQGGNNGGWNLCTLF